MGDGMKKSLIGGIFCLCVVAITASGCSGVRFRNILPQHTSFNLGKLSNIKEVAIFPLADYSYKQDFINPWFWGMNTKITEEMTDAFNREGLNVAIQDDVNGLLVQEGIINPERKLFTSTSNNAEILKEMRFAGASASFRRMALQIVGNDASDEDRKPITTEPVLQGVTKGLSKDEIIDLGKKLGVDAIIRGRILESGTKSTVGSLTLLREGISSNLFVNSNDYDYSLDQYTLRVPPPVVDTPTSIFDGAAGFLRFLLPSAKKSSVLQIRLYLQDAKTGEILWSNRAEVEYYPLYTRDYKATFDLLVKQSVQELMQDLFNAYPAVKP
jgi:hypothetical protein